MAHRRTASVIHAMKKSNAEANGDNRGVGVGADVGLAAIRIINTAASAIAPALPLDSVRSSLSVDSSVASSTTFAGDDDCMSMSSLDLLHSPSTPGTPSKIFPHPPRFPSSYSQESALANAQYTFRRFLSRALAALSPPGLPLKSPHLSPASSPAHYSTYLASLPTRTHAPVRRRAMFLALLTLIALCVWTLFTTSLGDQQSASRPYSDGAMRNWKDWRNKAQEDERERIRLMGSASFRAASLAASPEAEASTGNTRRPFESSGQHPAGTLELTPADELAALTAFIAALPWNALPSHVDPSAPLDPTVVLDFDPAHPRARDELAELRRETWSLNPVVLYGRSRHAPTREVRAALAGLNVDVKAGVMDVEVNERVDSEIVQGVLRRVVPSLDPALSNSDLPILIIGGKPVLGAEVPQLVENGEMARMLRDVGAKMVVPGGKKKKVHKN